MGNKILRCYVKNEGGIWVAVCLDFSLAAQHEDYQTVVQKLKYQIEDYVQDINECESNEEKAYFFNRKAPLSVFIDYWRLTAISKVKKLLFS